MIQHIAIAVVFDPPWDWHMMSAEAKAELGITDPSIKETKQEMDTTRTNLSADSTVNEVVAAYPAALRVMGRYGIDACCGGLKSLREVATLHRLSLEHLLADLESAIGPGETVLDVRSDLQAGQDPLGKILAAADGVAAGGRLVILVGFEPVPFYAALGKRGFGHQSERTADGAWRVTFTHGA